MDWFPIQVRGFYSLSLSYYLSSDEHKRYEAKGSGKTLTNV